MIAVSIIDRAVDWLCTFALHSTIALGLALLVPIVLRARALAWQESLLRLSLWVAVVSSTLQCSLLDGALSSNFVLPQVAAATPLEHATAAASTSDIGAALAGPAVTSMPVSWTELVALLAAFSALFGLFWFWRVHRRLARVLSTRQPATDSRILTTAAAMARELGLRQSPHVSRCEGIATPIAFGWLRPEICLPERAVALTDESLRAMLAHEIAHLRRGDPAWMWLAVGLQALFPWQPLLRLTRRSWTRLVELQCDAVAARHSSPTAVARCLVDVAQWLRSDRDEPLVALGMAARPSALRQRVEAALRATVVRPRSRAAAAAFSGLSLSALTLAAPGVATARAEMAPHLDTAEAQPTVADAVVIEAPGGQQMLALLRAEHDELTAEAEHLRAETRRFGASPELLQMEATLRRRLLDLDRSLQRLQALLERRAPRSR